MARRFSEAREKTMRDFYGDNGPGGMFAQSAADADEEARARQAEADAGALVGDGSVFNPDDHTVAEVQAYADANPDDLERLLDAENAGKARTTAISHIEQGIADRDAADDDDGS